MPNDGFMLEVPILVNTVKIRVLRGPAPSLGKEEMVLLFVGADCVPLAPEDALALGDRLGDVAQALIESARKRHQV